ncbi:hypothetical protein HMPREF9436_02531 [Faecalibacterium cf. prausnitzii KLE1255]|uniref:Uncharacterized protein n=1 Tax=Faecalibacterium cf. prausnitzii KLE1255 TaxID=748224 RepID=E2ZLH4_9FIRM|nr:hypothetical protein HMPREF9436_02531 [Faecalibacterium cf. prausnitzii KLE1255]
MNAAQGAAQHWLHEIYYLYNKFLEMVCKVFFAKNFRKKAGNRV